MDKSWVPRGRDFDPWDLVGILGGGGEVTRSPGTPSRDWLRVPGDGDPQQSPSPVASLRVSAEVVKKIVEVLCEMWAGQGARQDRASLFSFS